MPTVNIHYSPGTDKVKKLVRSIMLKELPGSRGVEFKHIAYLAENRSMFQKMVSYFTYNVPGIRPEELDRNAAKNQKKMGKLNNKDTCIFIDNITANRKFIREAKLNNATVVVIN